MFSTTLTYYCYILFSMPKATFENYNGSTTESLDCTDLDTTSDDDFKETVIINTKQIKYSIPTITNFIFKFSFAFRKILV